MQVLAGLDLGDFDRLTVVKAWQKLGELVCDRMAEGFLSAPAPAPAPTPSPPPSPVLPRREITFQDPASVTQVIAHVV